MKNSNAEGGIIIEFVQRGAYVKVSAIDMDSGVEASIVGDAAAGRTALEALAIKKLDYVKRKREQD